MSRGLRIGVTILLLLIIGVLGEVLFFQGTSTYKKFFSTPCTEPITYRVGTIDTRFNVSSEELRKVLAKSASVWNEAAGTEVLVYAPEDPNSVPVHLIYDERQQTVAVSESIDTQKSSLDLDRLSIEQLKNQYDALEKKYTLARTSFDTKFESYQRSVDTANKNGGAAPEEYRKLNATSASLKVEEQVLNEQVRQLNELANRIKSQVGIFNQSVQAVNSAVNSFNATTDQDFDAGKYIRTATSTRITIYYFDTESALTLEVAHEFGHALGIGHNDNSSSVMYPYSKNQKLVLSTEDKAALKEVCKIK